MGRNHPCIAVAHLADNLRSCGFDLSSSYLKRWIVGLRSERDIHIASRESAGRLLVAENAGNRVVRRIDDHTFGTAEVFLATICNDGRFIANSEVKRRSAVQRELAFRGPWKHVSCDTRGA